MKMSRKFTGPFGKKKTIARGAFFEKQKMLEVVAGLTPDVIYLFNTKRQQHVYINKEMGSLLGYSSEDIKSDGANLILQSIHPEDLPRVIQHIEKMALMPGDDVSVLEYRILDKHGRYLWFHVREQVYQRDSEQLPETLFGICQDITLRKLAEQRADYLARLYATISQVSQAIVRAKEQQELFENICKIAVDFGKFRLAWIGLFDPSSGQVNAAAAQGMGEIRLPFSSFNVYQSPYQDGMTGLALLSGQIRYSNDILQDPNMAHWHADAVRDQYHSAAAIPIRRDGKIFGIFSLYARDIDFFLTAEEQNLLAEMGEEISFALDTMEAKKVMRQWGDAFVNCAFGIALTNAHTNRLITCNPKFASQQGFSVDEVRGMPVLSMYAPQDHELVRQCIQEADRTGSVQYEAQMQRKDGSVYPVQMNVVSVRDDNGNLLYRVATQQNITERKQAEERLQTSERTLKLFVENAPAAIAMFDRDMKYIALSNRFLTDYRLPENDVIGRSHYEIFPEIPDRWRAIHRRCLAGAVEKADEDPFPREDGTLDWIRWEIHPWYEKTGEIGGILLFSEVITERKESEQALLESRERLKRAQQIANLGSWEFDLVQNRLIWSDDVYRILGLEPQEFDPTYEEFLERVHPEERAAVDATYRGSIQEGSDGYEIEHRVVQKSTGEIRYVQEKCEHLRDPMGKIVRSVGMVHDITERKLAEEQIASLVERLDLAAKSASLGVWDWDIVHDTLVWDARMYELYGTPKDKFTGAYEAWLNGLHPDDRACSNEAIQQTLRGEREYNLEFRVVWQDGTVRWLRAYGHVVRDPDNRPLRMIGINYDVTERRQGEEALRERNYFIETILENAPIGFAVNQIGNGQATFVSSKFETIYGMPQGSLNSVDDYFEKVYLDPVFREQIRERMLADMGSGDAARMRWENIPIKSCTGEFRVVTAVNIPLPQQNLMISTVQDVTERWRAEEEIRTLNAELERRVADRTAQLEAANRELEAFSYSVSHDLRAPLRGIDGWSLALFEDYHDQLDEKAREYIDRVRGETQRMGQLIDDLLRLSRLSRAEMRRGEVNLSELVRTVVSRIVETQPERSVEWIIQPDLIANGDAGLLEIVVNSLLSNAFKFTGKVPKARIEFGLTQQNGKSAYFIRDNGAGFNMAHAKNLFGAFQRMHKQSDFPGTGIGLATAQRIIHRHGGSVWAEAEKNAGATFYFTLEEL